MTESIHLAYHDSLVRIDIDFCIYHIYLQDHQGNNRMVVNASTDEVEQVNHYYAYGGLIGDLCTGQEEQEFKFGDKKLDRTYGLDLYDFEARQYDAIAPWFTSIDPLAEKYYSISPYAYCAGDPVNLVDPDGKRLRKIHAARMSKVMYGEMDPSEIGGGWDIVYQLQEQNDGYTAGLFSRKKKNGETEYAYGFRGSVGPISLKEKDWQQNGLQFVGLSTQYAKAMNDALYLNVRFKNFKLTFFGHSKAGGMAQAAAKVTGRDAVVHNSAGLSFPTAVQAYTLRFWSVLFGETPLFRVAKIDKVCTTWDILSLSPFGSFDMSTELVSVPFINSNGELFDAHTNDNFLGSYGKYEPKNKYEIK